jgi:mRNA-degrading endonuclease RelE of RelBE toxin-antitoxin system
MNTQIREQIEQLVDEAWELHDKARTAGEAEKYRLHIMELLSRLPENEERLRVVQ